MSQCSRVLEVLRDGRPHSIQEIHERAGTMRLNSRVADLRHMGFHVIYYRKDGLHTYQLIDGTVQKPGEVVAASGGAAPSDPPAFGPSLDAGGPNPVTPLTADEGSPPAGALGVVPDDSGRQLSVWEAA